MKSLLQTLIARSLGDTSKLLTALGLFFLAWGTIAPISTLSWWLRDGNRLAQQRPELPEQDVTTGTGPSCYLVFLAGVGNVADVDLSPGEDIFLTQMAAAVPNCVVVREVFPYSAVSDDVGGQPFFRWVWWLSERTGGEDAPARLVLKIRNLWRMALSADNRYGRAYNRGSAATILERMAATEAVPLESEQPFQIVLAGTSGGVQVALGAAPYLQQWLPVEITVLSFGGVFDGQTGFDAVEQVYHFYGQDDWIDNLGTVLFPSRWELTLGSAFNQAQRAGRYEAIAIGPHAHDGDRGYFGQGSVEGESAEDTTYLDLTLEQVKSLPIWPSP
ncbi:hypothetical protein IQ273_00235 [Nodosilinea sp. LEGE 07298]|uniref:hypothetical protein n=1 Tax=Nodosilinea sp. LEGE 07298 TaxID=2777970 RepID=UPI00187EE0A6|nr:hypothetical protein [Nodosilinea sp. LEGE 07298]MBE9107854.1 hypothetical protein [Nodosilinea sp. LEGE 07298]